MHEHMIKGLIAYVQYITSASCACFFTDQRWRASSEQRKMNRDYSRCTILKSVTFSVHNYVTTAMRRRIMDCFTK